MPSGVLLPLCSTVNPPLVMLTPLEAEFVTGGLDFSQFEQLGKSWAQLDAMDKSWSQLEMMGLQQWKEKEEEGQDVQQ